MLLTEDKSSAEFYIHSYEPGKIIINDKTYTHSVIVSPTQLIDDWPPQHFDQLESRFFESIAQQNPQVVLLGTGKKQHFPAAAILAELINKNIGVETMDTGAACRTFNLLVAEGRNVIAALLIT